MLRRPSAPYITGFLSSEGLQKLQPGQFDTLSRTGVGALFDKMGCCRGILEHFSFKWNLCAILLVLLILNQNLPARFSSSVPPTPSSQGGATFSWLRNRMQVNHKGIQSKPIHACSRQWTHNGTSSVLPPGHKSHTGGRR